MKRKLTLAAASAILAITQLFAGSAGAVVVAYDEGASGDLANNVGVTEFTLDIGTNTVMGNSSAVQGGGAGEFDDMILTIQPGQLLTSAEFSWTLNTGPDVSTQFRFHEGTTTAGTVLSGIDTVELGDAVSMGAVAMFASILPLGEGSYLLDQISIAVFENQPADFNYTWTFGVSAVPLPPAVWLFVSGLLFMVGFSRRQRAT